jgi:hypothetical protein
MQQNDKLDIQRLPLQNEDYYFENGYIVFTEKFLKDRGYCCGSGCRHCPYTET